MLGAIAPAANLSFEIRAPGHDVSHHDVTVLADGAGHVFSIGPPEGALVFDLADHRGPLDDVRRLSFHLASLRTAPVDVNGIELGTSGNRNPERTRDGRYRIAFEPGFESTLLIRSRNRIVEPVVPVRSLHSEPVAAVDVAPLAPGQERDLGTITLAHDPVLVGGRVLDERGEPVTDALVTATATKSYPSLVRGSWDKHGERSFRFHGRTDAEGRFEIEAMPVPGARHQLVVATKGRSSVAVAFAPGQTGLDVRLIGTGRIEGRISTRIPLPQSFRTCLQPFDVSGARAVRGFVRPGGEFTFEAVLPGDYVLVLSTHLDGELARRAVRVESGQTSAVDDLEPPGEWGEAVVHVLAPDGETPQLLTVRLEPDGWEGATRREFADAGGYARFAVRLDLRWRVVAHADGCRQAIATAPSFPCEIRLRPHTQARIALAEPLPRVPGIDHFTLRASYDHEFRGRSRRREAASVDVIEGPAELILTVGRDRVFIVDLEVTFTLHRRRDEVDRGRHGHRDRRPRPCRSRPPPPRRRGRPAPVIYVLPPEGSSPLGTKRPTGSKLAITWAWCISANRRDLSRCTSRSSGNRYSGVAWRTRDGDLLLATSVTEGVDPVAQAACTPWVAGALRMGFCGNGRDGSRIAPVESLLSGGETMRSTDMVFAVAFVLFVMVTGAAQLPFITRMPSANDSLHSVGRAVDLLGDFDGDGTPDVLIGLEGAIRVVSGAIGTVLLDVIEPDPSSQFGSTLASLADLDGDGRSEILVGAPTALPSGVVSVLSGATGAPLHVLCAPAARFGHSVDAIGDVDFDGFDDFVVGAPGAVQVLSSPRVSVFSGLTGGLIYDIPSPASPSPFLTDLFGYVVSRAGDVDADGTGDFLVSAPYTLLGPSQFGGQVYVYSGATGLLLHQLPGGGQASGFGTGVGPAGDLDGDGFDDVLVTSTSGNVMVFSGFDATSLLTLSAVGSEAALVGDIDGDGAPDYLVGVPFASPGAVAYAGEARLYSGQTGSLLTTFVGGTAYDHWGAVVRGGGDIDGDGRGDFAIASPLAGSPRSSGRVQILSSATQGTILQVDGAAYLDSLGASVATAGDVDADGFEDWIVGAPYEGGPGTARVLSGADGSLLYLFAGASFDARFGFSVDGAGDVDADGFDDVIIGAPDTRYGGPTTPRLGAATVFSGRTGAVIHTLTTTVGQSQLGWTVAGLGDVDSDGHDDVAVGVHAASVGGQSGVGSIRVYAGSDRSLLFEIFGTGASDHLGRDLDGGMDLDGDSVPDLIASGWKPVGGAFFAGHVDFISGVDGSLIDTIGGVAPSEGLGGSIALIEDVDGDGVAEVLLTTRGNPLTTSVARLHSGASGAVLHTTPGTPDFMVGVARAGDVDRDGVPDFAVARNDPHGRDGVVTTYSGADGGEIISVPADPRDSAFGSALAGGIDLSHDGFPDLLAGAPRSGEDLVAGAVYILTGAGARGYGAGLGGNQTLSLEWTLVTGTFGEVSVSGAGPGNSGIAAFSLKSAEPVPGLLPVLIEGALGLVVSQTFIFDGCGRSTAPVDLHVPALAGVTVFVQAFELAATVAASNGLEVLFVR